jgi:8-oxo-dGTP pyrophosphatase MutT (NUDIX family)
MKNNDLKQNHPIAAATIILAREKAGELQIYLLKRSTKSGFMAGNYVFPGGVVDATDLNVKLWEKHIDLGLTDLHQRLGGEFSEQDAIAYGVAAIRETFEEAGVLLAHRDDRNTAELEKIRQLRTTAGLSEGWLQNLVESQPWILAFSRLYRWSHWITPQKMKKRFDTRFFVASMPADQVCRPDNHETTHGVWISPQNGLAGNQSGDIPLSPPTVASLHELLNYRGVSYLIADARHRPWGKALVPRLVPVENEVVIVEPWDPIYNQKEIRLTSDELSANVVDVGRSFSRLWHHNGIWTPVRA